ncbi:transcriptional regulatory protein CusR [mine drainage metagenome]|uniref:Transcriptional regulatory protein CusR n=1 Tax=mine drainage metagenome TaxID=410659 RepID=A0A1J5SW49_9ZZZZ
MDEIDILIVEDEVKIAKALKRGISENGYKVELAFDGAIGKRMALAYRYNLIILDVNLPLINGFDLCRMIRKFDQTVPIIMLTALNATEDKLDGFDAGVDDYICKPFELKELLARIKALLKRTVNSQVFTDNILTVADLEMNLTSKEVKRAGTIISLTAKEFMLLEYFIRNKNRVVSRADIAEKVWGIDFDTQTNVIDVFVNYLRNKIDKNFPTRLIHTQFGMGYILKENRN